MADEMMVKNLEEVVVRFSGDSGDGMQLAGNIFSNVSATVGNDICTFPDYPADIRAPQGSLTGVSGFQIHVGAGQVYTPGDRCHVLVAMNPAALKTQIQFCKPNGLVITDSDSFTPRDLEKAKFMTQNSFEELGIRQEVLEVPISSMCKESLKDSGLDNKTILRCKNMFALGLVCWLFNRNLAAAEKMLRQKFAKKPEIAAANIKVLNDGYNYGANTHASVSTYKIESASLKEKGLYTDINGNKATAYGLIAAAEKAGLQLYLGSYPITPATDILHELAKHKSLGVKTVQCEDEIAGCASAVGASFAGAMAVTTTSGPGICLKSEAMNLAVIAELPLVIIDVQRGGPSTGLPTKSEQTDLMQVLYGRNGESPMPVIAATSPTNCFDAAYMAAKIALEHMTPVVLLTDAFVANGSAAWKLPDLEKYPSICPPYVKPDMAETWTPYLRNPETGVRYWATPGTEGFMHRIGGLEKSSETGVISGDPDNHEKMVHLRREKVEKIADSIPKLEILGDEDADLLIVGWGGTYGHLRLAMDFMRARGQKVALAHFQYINPLPKNAAEVLRRYKKIIVAEQNLGQFAGYLRMKVPGLDIRQFNQVKGQPFVTRELINTFTKLLEE
ncbi:2-oxoacid:acceptor oxidoreductase subunit alpha [Bacteroides pyogenes]|uniref:2-oxoacid:acceptor oxidoreductase subunit alpha n=1 Tax=Bacteroides pyogenes TaxID=310300 RepID=UPI001BA523B4|nr:2-oxoacid:acceptor oxidoreductase subunit alpha [Bacteroides pyogenes]MBR8705594.1 2-oxoglutarate oxidoreductase subunit KorA [Bacteroides pyogenes]